MASKPTNLAEYLSGPNSKAVREMLQPKARAKQPPIPLPPEINFGNHTEPETVDFFGPRGTNFPRPVRGQEITALTFTFGQEVGDYLASQIVLVFSPEILNSDGRSVRGKNVSDTEIELPLDYNPSNLGDLGMFIHEATHIWQRHTGLHRGKSRLLDSGTRDYGYTLDQLHSLNLNREQHAMAVQQWFIANYAYTYGLIGDSPSQTFINLLWGEPLHQVLGIAQKHFDKDPKENIPVSARIWLINVHYERLINQIRDPVLLRLLVTRVGQNFPNPF